MTATPLRYIPKPGPRRIATINGRPAWQVVQERKANATVQEQTHV